MGFIELSGEYSLLLKRRALKALDWARRAFSEGDYDTCAREVEYAVQLYIKSLIYRVLGEERRGHDVRSLLEVLVSALMEKGAEEEASMIIDFIRSKRRFLAELSEAHTRATYGIFEYGEREARILLSIAKEIIELLKRIENRVFGGEA